MSSETRTAPTGPGWWWRQGNHGPYIEEVDGDQNHAPFLAIDGSAVVDDGTWLAPIPSPAVSAAFEEYRLTVLALSDDPTRERPARLWLEAEVRVEQAIRAERDGAA